MTIYRRALGPAFVCHEPDRRAWDRRWILGIGAMATIVATSIHPLLLVYPMWIAASGPVQLSTALALAVAWPVVRETHRRRRFLRGKRPWDEIERRQRREGARSRP